MNRRGRPRREEQTGPDSPRERYERGERLRRAYPWLGPAAIAGMLGVHPSTYRRYRATFENETINARSAEYLHDRMMYDLTY